MKCLAVRYLSIC